METTVATIITMYMVMLGAPDGTIVEFPANMSHDEIRQMMVKKFSKMTQATLDGLNDELKKGAATQVG
jgi:hypothetical protein